MKLSVVIPANNEAGSIGGKAAFVLNNLFARDILKLRDVESALGTTVATELPYDAFIYLKAVNEGVPVVTSRPATPVAMALTQVAQAIVGIQTEAPGSGSTKQRRGLFARRSSG